MPFEHQPERPRSHPEQQSSASGFHRELNDHNLPGDGHNHPMAGLHYQLSHIRKEEEAQMMRNGFLPEFGLNMFQEIQQEQRLWELAHQSPPGNDSSQAPPQQKSSNFFSSLLNVGEGLLSIL